MYSGANRKTVVAIMGTGVTNGETVTTMIDCLGFDHLSLDVVLGTSNTTSNKPSVLKLGEADSSAATSSFSNISGFVGGTDFTIATHSTSTVNTHRFDVDLRGRQRYLLLTVTPRTTQAIVSHASLFRASEAADASTTKAGVIQLVTG